MTVIIKQITTMPTVCSRRLVCWGTARRTASENQKVGETRRRAPSPQTPRYFLTVTVSLRQIPMFVLLPNKPNACNMLRRPYGARITLLSVIRKDDMWLRGILQSAAQQEFYSVNGLNPGVSVVRKV